MVCLIVFWTRDENYKNVLPLPLFDGPWRPRLENWMKVRLFDQTMTNDNERTVFLYSKDQVSVPWNNKYRFRHRSRDPITHSQGVRDPRVPLRFPGGAYGRVHTTRRNTPSLWLEPLRDRNISWMWNRSPLQWRKEFQRTTFVSGPFTQSISRQFRNVRTVWVVLEVPYESRVPSDGEGCI